MQTETGMLLKEHGLSCYGEWTLPHVRKLDKKLRNISLPSAGKFTIDGSQIKALDSAGAWLLLQWQHRLINLGFTVNLHAFSEKYIALLTLVAKNQEAEKHLPEKKSQGIFSRTGHLTVDLIHESYAFLVFIGQLLAQNLRILRKITLFPEAAFSSQIIRTGVDALAIIALLSFMVGVVLAYQLGIQLRNYGANVFIADLLGLAVLREFGPLLTAIMVAGRTGSAFTAQLGMMKISQEIDALRTMGIAPEILLIMPRMLGLLVTLPLLALWADIFGLLGGMVMAHNILGITAHDFLNRLQVQVPLRSLLIGIGKAPVFALIIAGIGCFQGMAVTGTAESLGRNTTRSVVQAIFLIIVADAIFSVLFSWLKL